MYQQAPQVALRGLLTSGADNLLERNREMTRAHDLLLTPFLAACSVVLAVSAPVLAEAGDADYRPARTSWGTPVIEGIWDFRTLTPFERPEAFADKAVLTPDEAKAYRDQEIAARDVDKREGLAQSFDVEGAYNSFWWDWGQELDENLRTSLVVDPPNGKLPPLTPEAMAAMKEQNRSRKPPVRDLFSYSANPAEFRPVGPESVGLSERCLVGFNAGPPLNPGAYNNNLRIVQSPDYVVLVSEMVHDARIVPMDGRAHLPEDVERWRGDARGHWDGDTLVVESTNFSSKLPTMQLPATLATALESGAVGNANDMRLTERFTPTAEGRLLYEYTLEDAKTFTAPFTVQISMKLSSERMFEYACHEGNYAMSGMLRGARLLEREDASASGPTGGGSD
jgi:hypothetical protein